MTRFSSTDSISTWSVHIALVHDLAVFIDDVHHVGHLAVGAVHGASQVIHEQTRLDSILGAAIASVLELLFPRATLVIVLARMRLADVDREKPDIAIAELAVEAV